MTWLNWMPHLRSLRMDTQMLSKLIPTTIDQFSSLEKLMVYQVDNASNDDALSVIARLGVSSSLQDICIEQYKTLDFQSMIEDNFLLTIYQICRNMHKLETMTIEFTNPLSLFVRTMLEELAGTEKKNCQFECIYVSENFIQLWLEK